jgi:hypothetical protein
MAEGQLVAVDQPTRAPEVELAALNTGAIFRSTRHPRGPGAFSPLQSGVATRMRQLCPGRFGSSRSGHAVRTHHDQEVTGTRATADVLMVGQGEPGGLGQGLDLGHRAKPKAVIDERQRFHPTEFVSKV